MTDSEHGDVIKGIGRLEAGQLGLKEQLTDLKKEQGELSDRVGDVQKGLLMHVADCVLFDRVRALEIHVAATKKAEEVEETEAERNRCTRNKWEDRAWHFLGILVAVLVVLVLEHADVFRSTMHATGTK